MTHVHLCLKNLLRTDVLGEGRKCTLPFSVHGEVCNQECQERDNYLRYLSRLKLVIYLMIDTSGSQRTPDHDVKRCHRGEVTEMPSNDVRRISRKGDGYQRTVS